MARKVRKVKKRKIKKAAGHDNEVRQTELSTASIKPKGEVKSESRAEGEFRKEYAYVLDDLRRVFILAVALFALLIILNLVIQ